MNSQKRIDSFFKKSDSDTPKKKQCQEKDVKENEVPEASKSKPITKNPPSTDSADSSSNINLAKISDGFILNGRTHFRGSITLMVKCSVSFARNVHKSQMILLVLSVRVALILNSSL